MTPSRPPGPEVPAPPDAPASPDDAPAAAPGPATVSQSGDAPTAEPPGQAGPGVSLAEALTILGAMRPGSHPPQVNTEARLAALCVLRRESENVDRRAFIAEVVARYIRANACWMDGSPPTRPAAAIPDDIQLALELLAFGPRPPGAAAVPVDLTRVDLRGAVLWGGDLRGARLNRVHAEFCDLGHARLDGALLWGANLSGALLTESSAVGASFWAADLRRVSLRGAVLRGAVLSRALLAGADLRDADLRDADLTGVHLSDARLDGADLRGVRGPAVSGTARPAGDGTTDVTSVATT